MDHNTKMAERQVPDSREFLTFVLGDEEYGIDILRVQEIRGYDAVTKIANSPAFIKGVINLRGAIVPIIDLRMRFNLDRVEYNEFTVVIILNVLNRTIGIVVDGVSDVAALSLDEIKPPPEFSSTFDTQYLMGLGTVDERMLIIVDIEKLLGSQTMQLLSDNLDQKSSVEQTATVA